MDSKVIQIRSRGNLTLPARLRERYALEDGDPVTVVDLDGVILLAPKTGIVPKLAAELERLREGAGLSLDGLLAGLPEKRKRSLRERADRG